MEGENVKAIKTNIFLTGFMGSGKSHWGRIWARQYALNFYDLDTQIEKSFRMSVEEIFEKQGEEKFREIERLQLRKFESKKGFLMSCGGGTPCFFDNMDWMKDHGKVIYLRASPGYILKRVIDETEKRPMLKEINSSELLFFIESKLKEREPFYNQSHHILDAENLTGESLNGIIEPNK